MCKFNEAIKINCNEFIEKKKTGRKINKNGKWIEEELSYLSWANAWKEFKNIYPEADYSILLFDGKPFIYDENTGYMVFTEVTADEKTYQMWLPVMNGNNKAMKSSSYQYTTKNGDVKTVEAATMFDVDTAIMRCLTKNLAMFGLGLYIYAGEDLPFDCEEEITKQEAKQETSEDIDNRAVKELEAEKKYSCVKCGTTISKKVADFSMKKYKSHYCMKCQKEVANG